MALSVKMLSLVLGIVLLKLSIPANGQGETNLSTTLGDKQYFVGLTQKVNWYRAAQICSVLGMSLASIESETEKTNLQQYLFSNSHLTDKFWLSGTDLALSKEFTWMSSGNRFSYKNWADSEPASGVKNRCVQTTENFEWVVDVCDNLHYFICSRPVTPDCGVTGRCSYNYNNAG